MPNKFKQRSDESELLDAPDIPKELLLQNLQELNFINRLLGGHKITMNGIKKLVTEKNKVYHIVDLGCGSGDTMKHIATWARMNGFKVKLTGVDKNIHIIDYLDDYCKDYHEISGVAMDYLDFLKSGTNLDIVHCSLFCHHLKDDELAELFSYLKQYSKNGFVINDLHRNWFAYYGVKFITYILNGSALSRNDGPVSILRAFKRNELKSLLLRAEIKKYSINWKWAFRYLVIGFPGT